MTIKTSEDPSAPLTTAPRRLPMFVGNEGHIRGGIITALFVLAIF